MEKIQEVVFYKLEKAIKNYRQYAQKRITEKGLDITIDQWLVLKTINENDNLSQRQVADLVFKDYASVTRIIELLVKKGYLKRDLHSKDRRRFVLTITSSGEEIIEKVYHIVLKNRQHALKDITDDTINIMKSGLDSIIANCRKK